LKNADAAEVEITGGTITCEITEVDLNLESNLEIANISWEGPAGFSSNEEDVTATMSGVYTATVVSANGCVTIKSIIVNEAGEVPELSLLAEDLSCGNPLVTIQVFASSNSLNYSWTGPNGFEFSGKNPVVGESGIYSVVAADNFGCAGTFEIEVFGDPDDLEYSVLKEDIICPRQFVEVEVVIDNPSAFIKWTLPDGSVSFSNPVVSDMPGTYEIEILSNGCSVVDQVEVLDSPVPLPVFSIVQDSPISCVDGSAELSLVVTENADRIDSIRWDGPQGQLGTENEITVDIFGVYRVLIYTTDGCLVGISKALEYEPNVPTAEIIAQNINCVFADASLTAVSEESLNYEWFNSAGTSVSTDSILNTNVEGGYTLEVHA